MAKKTWIEARVPYQQTEVYRFDEVTDISIIDKNLISEVLHEAGGIEANVATGYHAIEFYCGVRTPGVPAPGCVPIVIFP